MAFIHDDFLLSNDAAVRLYHDYAASQPIIDYHNHLSPKDIASNRRFENLFEMWVNHDHYKWRAMRANGVSERLVTGEGSPKEKFLAFAATVPYTIRNPIYHWTHLELKRFFDIDELLCEANAEEIWENCNQQIASRDDLTTQGILKTFNVTALCTTDDPVDSLEYHQQVANSDFETKVYPAFRPDWALFVHRPDEFKEWLDKLSQVAGIPVESLDDLLAALRIRHDFFHALGCRLSDHGCESVPANFCDAATASEIFDTAKAGVAATSEQHEQYSTFMLIELAKMDAEKSWTNQFHTGVWRNNNTRLFEEVGRDLGCDSIGDTPQGRSLGRFLDRLDRENMLPKTIVYNLNPSDNYLISTMIGNFQGGEIAGKMQFGSGWWYLDQKEGMEWQINALSSTGLISRFVGMLTDSRSFMSFIRHEYFRRILCNLFGKDMASGEMPNDFDFVGGVVQDICYGNAKRFLELEGS
ncbi:glucuronate isomerase [Mariniblastus sp.]|nr:glucuronate isomerase [Mariniblastus sp.]